MDKKVKKQGSKKRDGKKRKGNLLFSNIQGIASVIAIIALIKLNLLPAKYLLPIVLVIALLWVLTFASAKICRKRGLAGKLLSVAMSIILLSGSFYALKTSGMLSAISDSDKKVDKIVVAVRADDDANSIKDAKDYKFGIQLSLKGNDVKDTVKKINAEVKQKINTVECTSLNEQAQNLFDEEVDAIIYNSAYTSILKEAFPDYDKQVKVIFEYEIVNKLDKMMLTKEEIEVSKQPFTVYLSGIDVAGEIETTGRSDVNILAVVNPETHQVLLVTTPRDYYVEIPGISGGMPDKLTHAGMYGVDKSMATLSELYDTPVDFYARVNFTSMIQIVDALGGVDVNSEYEFTTSEDSGKVINISEGMNHLNGEDALAFARERQNVPGGDYQRGKDQQAVLTAMIKKAVSPAMLKGISDIIDSVSGNVDTNMSIKQVQALIKSQILKPASWNIKSLDAKGEDAVDFCYSASDIELYVCYPDQESIEEIKQAIDQVQNGEILTDTEVAE